MILKNLMEEKQLDFSQPLMSVRRFSSTGASMEAEEKKRKDKRSDHKTLPLPVYKSELQSGPVSNAVTVPFQWEKIPGRPKDETKTPSRPSKKPPFSPKLPPGRILIFKNEVAAQDSEIRSKCDENGRKENGPFEKEEKGSLNSEDSDGAYLDALDTLSTTESFFINCSTSGLSELDGPDLEAFTTDLHSSDFMIRRFLSAAKAMAADTSQHPIGRQNVQQDKPWESQKVAGGDKQQRLLNSYAQIVSEYYIHDAGEGGSDGDDEEDNNSLYEYSSAKLCGLLPRFYLNRSFCILNPVPGVKTQAQLNSVHRLRNISSNDRSSNAVNEKQKSRGQKMTDSHEEKLEFIDQTNPINLKNGSQNLDGLLKQNPSMGGAEKDGSSKVNAFDSHRRCFREFLEIDQDSFSPVVEKTLYIDSVHKLKSLNSSTSSSDLKFMIDYGEENLDPSVKISDLNETLPVDSLLLKNFNVFDSDNNLKSCKLTDERTCDLSENGDNFCCLDDDCAQPCNLVQSSLTSTESKSNVSKNINLETKLLLRTSLEESSRCPTKGSSTFRSSDENMDLRNQILRRVSYQESSHGSRSQFSLAPPLPKSPSESWLKRTLPTVSRSSPSSRLHAKSTARKITSHDPKWKGTVKTTQINHGNMQFSELTVASPSMEANKRCSTLLEAAEEKAKTMATNFIPLEGEEGMQW